MDTTASLAQVPPRASAPARRPPAARKRKSPPPSEPEHEFGIEPRQADSRVRIEIVDDGHRTVRFVPWGEWMSTLRQRPLAMSHTMPVMFNAAGTTMTLYPALECDAKHVMGSDLMITVELPSAAVSTSSSIPSTTTQHGIN